MVRENQSDSLRGPHRLTALRGNLCAGCPSWCEKVANEPQTVKSLLTQESVLLSAEEVSMYRWLFEAYFNFLYRPERLSNDPNVKQKYEEGMKWFDSTNPKALDALFP